MGGLKGISEAVLRVRPVSLMPSFLRPSPSTLRTQPSKSGVARSVVDGDAGDQVPVCQTMSFHANEVGVYQQLGVLRVQKSEQHALTK
eukprot:COSAG02_NODE_11389_length_1733_cov_1.650551_2_plen_88_part_00